MNDNDLITRREVERALLEKGQKSRRYKLGEIWELNFDEIREALSEYQPEITRCKDCKWYKEGYDIDGKWFTRCNGNVRTYGHTRPDWFCADGEKG